jgi:hypothetical protein
MVTRLWLSLHVCFAMHGDCTSIVNKLELGQLRRSLNMENKLSHDNLSHFTHVELAFGTRTVWSYKPDGPRSRRSAVVARTVRACAESVRILSILRVLLVKSAGLTRETTFNGSTPPLYIDEGIRPIEPPTIDQIKSTYYFYLMY